MRVLLAGMGRFPTVPAPVGQPVYAEAIREDCLGHGSALDGFVTKAEALELEVLYTGVLKVGPEGRVDRETYDALYSNVVSELRGWKVDAVFAALDGDLHYAEAPDGVPEVDFLTTLHQRLGAQVPLVAAFERAVPADARLAQVVQAVVSREEHSGASAAELGELAALAVRRLLGDEPRPAPAPSVGLGPARWATDKEGPSLGLVLLEDPTPGVAVGETLHLQLHVSGVQPGKVSIGIFICDELGAIRWDTRTERDVGAGAETFVFGWPVHPGDPPGTYSIRAMVYAPADRWQGIAAAVVPVVAAGGDGTPPARIPPVPRDRLLVPAHSYPDVSVGELERRFAALDERARATRNADGSWGRDSNGRRGPKHIAVYARTADVVHAYLLAYELFGEQEFAALARSGLRYLSAAQLENGAWCAWPFTWITPHWVWLKEACFFDTGSVGRAFIEAYRVLGDESYLEAVRRAVRYVESAPYTGNNNYDAYSLWFLGPYYELTKDADALAHAVARCREAVLIGQQPYGGFPAHNQSAGYQGFIVYGLMRLLQALSREHPYVDTLRRQTVMAANFLVWLMDEGGRLFSGWEYDRTFGVTPEGRPSGTSRVVPASAVVAALHEVHRTFGMDEQVFRGLCHGTSQLDGTNGAGLLEAVRLLRWAKGL